MIFSFMRNADSDGANERGYAIAPLIRINSDGIHAVVDDWWPGAIRIKQHDAAKWASCLSRMRLIRSRRSARPRF